MTYERRHKIISFDAREKSTFGKGFRALSILQAHDTAVYDTSKKLTYEDRLRLEDAVEDLYLLSQK